MYKLYGTNKKFRKRKKKRVTTVTLKLELGKMMANKQEQIMRYRINLVAS